MKFDFLVQNRQSQECLLLFQFKVASSGGSVLRTDSRIDILHQFGFEFLPLNLLCLLHISWLLQFSSFGMDVPKKLTLIQVAGHCCGLPTDLTPLVPARLLLGFERDVRLGILDVCLEFILALDVSAHSSGLLQIDQLRQLCFPVVGLEGEFLNDVLRCNAHLLSLVFVGFFLAHQLGEVGDAAVDFIDVELDFGEQTLPLLLPRYARAGSRRNLSEMVQRVLLQKVARVFVGNAVIFGNHLAQFVFGQLLLEVVFGRGLNLLADVGHLRIAVTDLLIVLLLLLLDDLQVLLVLLLLVHHLYGNNLLVLDVELGRLLQKEQLVDHQLVYFHGHGLVLYFADEFRQLRNAGLERSDQPVRNVLILPDVVDLYLLVETFHLRLFISIPDFNFNYFKEQWHTFMLFE